MCPCFGLLTLHRVLQAIPAPSCQMSGSFLVKDLRPSVLLVYTQARSSRLAIAAATAIWCVYEFCRNNCLALSLMLRRTGVPLSTRCVGYEHSVSVQDYLWQQGKCGQDGVVLSRMATQYQHNKYLECDEYRSPRTQASSAQQCFL